MDELVEIRFKFYHVMLCYERKRSFLLKQYKNMTFRLNRFVLVFLWLTFTEINNFSARKIITIKTLIIPNLTSLLFVNCKRVSVFRRNPNQMQSVY